MAIAIAENRIDFIVRDNDDSNDGTLSFSIATAVIITEGGCRLREASRIVLACDDVTALAAA